MAPRSPIITRAQKNFSLPRIFTNGSIPYPPRHCLTTTATVPDEPSSYSAASQFPEWCDTMSREYDALMQNQIWTSVPPTSSFNIVGCMWVFYTKLHVDGSIECWKPRLIAKGFHQQLGIDYNETFSPIVKFSQWFSN